MSLHQPQKPGLELPREPLLLAAALAGLLCFSQACSPEESSASNTSTGGASGTGGSSSSAGSAGAPATPEITSSMKVEGLDAAGFKELCDARNGTVEVMPHCGGFATARGFAYDTTNSMLSEHTCKGANTCGGWNCVTDE